MSTATLTRVTAKTAQEVAGQFELGEPARKLLRDYLTPRQFLDLLVADKLYLDGTRFLGHALPKREAVWWACVCVGQEADPAAKVAPALQAAVKWVVEPSDANRRAAQAPGEADNFATPAGFVAMAVFWSGGSLIGPQQVEV